MPRKIAINSHSTGKFRTEVINNRPHLVTEMVSIVGDSVMNGLGYPDAELDKSFMQLNALHAPASHPTLGGENVSAFHPLAVNAFSVGGIVLNPRKVGKQVINDLAFDIAIAEKDERGIEIMRRIEAGESIGVSTGLNAKVTNKKGKMGNTPFEAIVSDIEFNHVAILLDEPPAGDETFTINEDVTICNLDELIRSSDDAKPIITIVNENSDLKVEVVSVSDDEISIKLIPVGNAADNNQEVHNMDKEKIVLAIIGNSANRYTMADKDSLMSMSETDLVNGLHSKIDAPEPTIEAATAVVNAAGLHVNNITAEQGKDFADNAEDFTAFMANKKTARDELEAKVLANSKMQADTVSGMSDAGLQDLASSLMPGQDYSAQRQSIKNNDRQAEKVKVDYSH